MTKSIIILEALTGLKEVNLSHDRIRCIHQAVNEAGYQM